jgi:hypothetical protein
MLCNRCDGTRFFDDRKGNLNITRFPVTYTAGRRKKVGSGYEAKAATEVLLWGGAVNRPNRSVHTLVSAEQKRYDYYMETNQMANLSPSAQAVLNVVLNEAAPLSEQQQARTNAAAILRAAAGELKMPEDLGFYSNAFWAGYINAAAKLLAIANELEGSN